MKALLGLVIAVVTIASFFVPESANFQQPQLARILFWHLPCPILSSVFELMAAWFSFRYIKSQNPADDIKALASIELGFMFGLLAMATGIVFSRAQWGAWWQNDPRQTSYLLVLLIYAAYFLLRSAYSDPDRRASYGAGYILAATLPMLFLVFVFPRIPQIEKASFHPTESIMSGQIYGSYAIVLILTVSLTAVVAAWLFALRVRVGLLEIKKLYGLETSSDNSPAPAVVRRVRVSDDH